jgi:hypothetical protein
VVSGAGTLLGLEHAPARPTGGRLMLSASSGNRCAIPGRAGAALVLLGLARCGWQRGL